MRAKPDTNFDFLKGFLGSEGSHRDVPHWATGHLQSQKPLCSNTKRVDYNAD
jgi:hypothetical protein